MVGGLTISALQDHDGLGAFGLRDRAEWLRLGQRRPVRGYPSDRRRVIRGRSRSRVALAPSRATRLRRALERDLARFDTGGREDAASSPARAAGTGGGRRGPGRGGRAGARCVRRRRCGPSGPKAVGGAQRAAVSPALAPAACGQPAAPRPGRCSRRVALSAGRRRPGPGARSAPLAMQTQP